MNTTAARRLIAVLVVSVALIGCSDTKTGTTASASSAAPSSAPASSAAPTRPFAVTRRDVVVEDPSRPTAGVAARGLPERSSRTLPLMLLVPDGPGPFPLVEFSHGVNSDGPRYLDFLQPIAAAGYVVVAPTFPLSSGPSGTVGDYPNQAADAYFAIDSVIKMNSDAADPLHGRVDTEHLAMGGHSLGALTTYGAVYNSCCAQPRIDAAFLVAGIELPFTGGSYDHRPPTPLLLTHGDADRTVPVSGSDNLFPRSTGPTAYVRFAGGTHSGVLAGDDGALLDQTVIAWLDRWLGDDAAALDRLRAAVDASNGLATLQTRGL